MIRENFNRHPETGRATTFRPHTGFDPMDGCDERVSLSKDNPCQLGPAEELQVEAYRTAAKRQQRSERRFAWFNLVLRFGGFLLVCLAIWAAVLKMRGIA